MSTTLPALREFGSVLDDQSRLVYCVEGNSKLLRYELYAPCHLYGVQRQFAADAARKTIQTAHCRDSVLLCKVGCTMLCLVKLACASRQVLLTDFRTRSWQAEFTLSNLADAQVWTDSDSLI